MRAAVVQAVGSPPVAADVDEPAREPGSALVAVAAAPLNPVEIRVAAGRHPRPPQPPYVPGLEGAGTVIESDRLAPGTRVRFESPALPGLGAHGTLAERAAVPRYRNPRRLSTYGRSSGSARRSTANATPAYPTA